MSFVQRDDYSNLLKLKYGIIGDSAEMTEAVNMLLQAAPTDLTILVTGETGTGKELFAQAIHGESKRNKMPFVSVNCGAIPETLLESELFGHEKGAFTGATDQRKGFFEVADKGTIFLDEIGEMPVGTQVKLLRVLESGEFSRLGSSKVHRVDVRVIAATNRLLEEEVRDGNFRQDLFFRLKSVHIILPPLRKHSDDIKQLSTFFAEKTAKKISRDFEGISLEALNILKSLHWPGNVRELKNMMETIVTLEKGAFITPAILSKYLPRALPAHSMENIPKESSIVPIEQEDAFGKMELGLIFKTLLELKSDIGDIKNGMKALNWKIEELQDKEESVPYNVIKETESIEEYLENTDDFRLDDMEARLIRAALHRYDGNRRLAAQSLGISERTLYRKISDYDIEV